MPTDLTTFSFQFKYRFATLLPTKSLTAQQPSTLREEIEREKETVNEKKEKVLQAASEMMEKANFDKVTVSDRAHSYKGGAFDGSIKQITGKLTEVAHDLNKTAKNVKDRLESLQSTLEEVEGEWKSKAGTKRVPKQGFIAEARRSRKLHRNFQERAA